MKRNHNICEIGKDIEVFQYLIGNNSIIDREILRISLYYDHFKLKGEIILGSKKNSDYNKLILIFSEVEEFSFFKNRNDSLGYITLEKFFTTGENEFYLSLDPYDEMKMINENDNDFILARSITVCAIVPRKKEKETL